MTKDEALRLALQELELEEAQTHYPSRALVNAIIAVKAALEAKDEPVAWVNKERNTITWDKLYPDMDALYTALPQRK